MFYGDVEREINIFWIRGRPRLCTCISADFGEKEAKIFSAHLAFMHDQEFIDKVKKRIAKDLINVEQALLTEINDFAALLAEMENEYIRERASDVIDIGNRILKNLLQHQEDTTESIPPNSILVAPELYPSDTLHLKRGNINAIVTERGGDTSHSAILARSLNIPGVTGVKGIIERARNGCYLLVDGEKGVVIIEPSSVNKEVFSAQKLHFEEKTVQSEEAQTQGCVTKDGQRITLQANIGRPYELDLVDKYRLDGVGLFRTEYLFLSRNNPPDEAEQTEVFKSMASCLSDKPFTIRTFDLGADKLASFLSLGHETNPYMGIRGLRLSLKEKNLLRTQLRALLKACEYGQVKLLLPMVIQQDDIQETKQLLSEEAKSLGIERLPPLGIMVETPAAIFSLDSLLEEVEFISIGTNDLTQFILAADRNAPELLDIRSVLHPAVIHALSAILRAANEKNIPASICGEAAADPLLACFFIGLGFRSLSMSPIKTNNVKHLIRGMSMDRLHKLAQETKSAPSHEKAWRRLKEGLRDDIQADSATYRITESEDTTYRV